ncbi:hypothetical protein QWY93_12585 [Echinicola jeungdonensis]|uniref:Tetratricopeptide repeat protein n=1 Tax=Echinicola jeungdonensis TaxID=709343 RepID=A0ABV5J921_9BACT|nr:tetratricopeptide repeat protein [Echinicola jeungdonensis]MDN3670162.1 hypothetical protein [Echinicola jeungdonensis]
MSKLKGLAIVLFFVSGVVMGQETIQAPTRIDSSGNQKNQADQRIYQRAMRFNDPMVAKSKLYELMDRNPENLRYPELLASLYFDLEQFSSAALVAMDVLKKNDKSIPALKVAAYSLEQLGALDRALPHFESLHLLSGDLFSLYKTSYLQYSLKKYDEALNSVNMLIKNSKSEEQMLSFPKKDNSSQEVSMKAAALNLKGMIYKEQGSNTEARTAFEAALANSPDFEIVQDNLKELN